MSVKTVAVGFVCFVMVTSGTAIAGVTVRASAQTQSSAPPLDPRAVATAIDLTRTRDELEMLERRIAVVAAQITAARFALEQVDSQIGTNQARLAAMREQVRARASTLYLQGGSRNAALLTIGDTADLGSAQRYVSSANGVDEAQVHRLAELQRTLDAARADQVRRLDEVSATMERLESDRERIGELHRQEQALLDQWGAVPVMGDAWLSAAQLAAWFRSTGAVPRLSPGTTIEDLARLYIVEGAAEHVRGDLAFAQSVIETGSFGVAAGNNFSGIGVCDSCQGGYAFASPLDGVRAQIQLLRNYADPQSRAANLANPPSPDLYGKDPVRAAATYDSFFLKGKAPLWNVMGNGNWATDPTYARKVIELFARMVAFSASPPT